MTGAHCMHSVEQSMILCMFHYYCTIMICLNVVSVLTLAVFRGSFPYGDVERGSTHLPSMCVEPLSVSVCWSEGVRSKFRTNSVHVYYRSIYARQARDIGSMLVHAGQRRIDSRPALIRHWFSVSCLLGSLHNFKLFLTIYYSMLCFLDSVS